MSHHITLRSAVIDFKRSLADSSSLAREKALVGITAVALAYTAQLPDHGPMAGSAVYRKAVARIAADFVSDINEHLYFDMKAALALGQSLYILRYEIAHAPLQGIQAPALCDLLKDAVGEDAQLLIQLWAERFINVARVYQQEHAAKEL